MRLEELLVYDDIVIQCHDNPDADAIASGFALYEYFLAHDKKPEFIYRGANMISKSNLLMMVTQLEIPIEYAPDFDRVPELLITCDCQIGQRNVTNTDAKTYAVIDHHQPTVNLPELNEVRRSVGSCATVIWDMMRVEDLDVNLNKNLATALYYGLYTDTNKFSELSHPLDRDMIDNLIINKSLITEMSNSNISLEELKITGKAIFDYDYHPENRYLIIHAEPCDPNILGVISDFAMETADVDVCVAYFASQSEIKFSVRSCVKEVHANELASYIADGIGGGGGHLLKAGGTIWPDKITSSISEVIAGRIRSYYDSYVIIYAKDTILDTSLMKLYTKREQRLGTVKLTDVFPSGTLVEIRTLEGDVNVTIADDTYLMIGIEGEIYPIKEEKLVNSYQMTGFVFVKDFEYQPTIRDLATGVTKPVIPYAKTVISPPGTSVIYAAELTMPTKLFTAWDDEKYYSGNPGDIIAVRQDDPHDIYIIKGRLFDQLYKEI